MKPDLLTDSAHLLLTEIMSLDDSSKESLYKRIHSIAGKIKDPEIQTDLLNDLALYDSKNYLNYLHEVIRITRDNGLDNKLFWALNNLGYYYKSANRLDSAMSYGLKARALVAPKNSGEKVSITMLVADLYYWARMYDKAESLYKKFCI
ncbi:MAG: hypothetical protein IPN68_12520 [Bacteroidetes bacterium]|nr:hypothetical protein [Bacteroidota bacterium]